VGSVGIPGSPGTEEDAMITVSPLELARGALKQVGYGARLVFAHWKHSLTLRLLSILPESFLIKQMNGAVEKQNKGK
jgi:hypothetical protein